MNLRPDGAVAGNGLAVLVGDDESFINGAVVAPIVHEDLRPPGQMPSQPQNETIRVGCADGKLPFRQTEASGQFLTHPSCVDARKHHSRTTIQLRGNRRCNFIDCVAGHGPCVTQAKVGVTMTVEVDEFCASRFGH